MNSLKGIIYNCRQATFLIEKKQVRKLTFRESVELRIHLTGCSVCRVFQKQSVMINRMVKNLIHDSQKKDRKLDDAFKRDLQDKIEGELNKNR
ncbi:hypothetical protein ACFP1I_30880 [Dyadobacter subterraneus]|uniref:Zf-HC2 domain-containing protein n=1 Tax=Dyadobacter subterraneus TaxID=2773304 RepID=A0ABR9W8C3_9BACT|nr:hypothetical protein [Dyadobacter subterraneus]MBE9461723.1 hypothetical protein [Dyadobacter subterraneus]